MGAVRTVASASLSSVRNGGEGRGEEALRHGETVHHGGAPLSPTLSPFVPHGARETGALFSSVIGSELSQRLTGLLYDPTSFMTNYIQTKICEISEPNFQSLVSELCHCVALGRDQFEYQPLTFLLMAIGREGKALTKAHLPTEGILTRKVDKLPVASVVHGVCVELVTAKKTHIEFFDGKAVLSLIKQCHKVYCPRPAPPKRLTRQRRDYLANAELIKRRRKNGDL